MHGQIPQQKAVLSVCYCIICQNIVRLCKRQRKQNWIYFFLTAYSLWKVNIICQWICAAELTQCCTCSRGSLGPTRIKLTAGINFICNGSEWFQQILIICLAIHTPLSELCCRPWLGALFVSCIWDELGWFSPRHVLVQYINWDCGHTG